MRRSLWPAMSLARKISLLFGSAVLATIGATLTFPWYQMTALNEQAMLLEAKRVASTAYQAVDLQQPDWTSAQTQLSERWAMLVDTLDLIGPLPRLIRLSSAGEGFQSEAIDRLRRYSDQRYYWRLQRDGQVFRFAMAIRATNVDQHPKALRGIIDVRLPTRHDEGVWNAIVTVLAGACGAVLAIMVFYLVTQRLVLNPVRSLRKVAERVKDGDIHVRSNIRSGDEFQKLSEAFNDMLAHLKAAQEEQQKINRSLDIKLGELAETNVALYESARVKGEFLANVTHELRTPLVSIIGFAELLRDAADGAEIDRARLARFSGNILTSGRSLLDLINDLLDVAKIEAGKLELNITEFSIGELASDLIDFVRPLADKREHILTLELAPNLSRCRSDAGRVKQILYNLLSNAVKFTPTGGRVSLSLTGEEHSVTMCVSDNGPGIPQKSLGEIFDKFHQLDGSETREHSGSGLGLAITKELVGMLGGSIHVQSEISRGSTFTVKLPVSVADGSTR